MLEIMGITYADAGVDRDLRAEAKKTWELLKQTRSHSAYGEMIDTPYNTLYPIGNSVYHTKCCDSVGTKVLLAQAVQKHDTVGIDAVAAVVNDAIRCGAKPIAMTNIIDSKKSSPSLFHELQKGLNKGASMARCPMVAGESADVPEIVAADYNLTCDCVGEVREKDIVKGNAVVPGDVIIGIRSSGMHTNGASLLRKSLFRKWGGKFDLFAKPDGFEKELVFEALTPTNIYVDEILELMSKIDVRGAVHITGDAYIKFDKIFAFSPGIGFEFRNFRPQEIFSLIQKTGNIEDKEMLSTFNMGWGFAVIVKKEDADATLDILNRHKESEVIGSVTGTGRITADFNGRKILLK